MRASSIISNFFVVTNIMSKFVFNISFKHKKNYFGFVFVKLVNLVQIYDFFLCAIFLFVSMFFLTPENSIQSSYGVFKFVTHATATKES